MTLIRRTILGLATVAMVVPQNAFGQSVLTPHEQDFILTAYYSPLPDQCCYVKGSEVADKILNGNGTHGADGTPVYPGMLAAPGTYAFGTRIVLPGLGTMTVHDRGGAILELEEAHRLDVWAGHGEEGLARALAFGVQRIRGTVYPKGSVQPAESFALETLPAPKERLRPFLVAEAGLIDMHPGFGEQGLAVSLLQENLKSLGYFEHAVTGLYGDVTRQALANFLADMQLGESADELTPVTAAYIMAALEVKDRVAPIPFIGKESAPADIQKAQRILRYFGFYKGRTNGQYSDTLFNAILAYQQSQGLVGDATAPGAGRIGPLTKDKLEIVWKRQRIATRARHILALREVRQILVKKGTLMNAFLEEGKNGPSVRLVQQILAAKGFFPHDMINGNYGPLTAQGVAQYQIARGLLGSATEKGAGTIGPITLKTLRQEQVRETYRLVRAQGWNAL